MTTYRRTLIAALALTSMAGIRADAAPCATQPPPAGLAAICRSMDFALTNPRDHGAIEATLAVRLREWMDRCFPGRPPSIPDEGEQGSVEYVVDLVKAAPSHVFSVRILPEYTASTYTEGGRTCHGASAVSFRIAGARGTVDTDEEEIEVIHDAPPTSEMIKEAATAAQQALRDPSVPGSASLSRFLSVLHHMASSGSDFDDTWYNVQPIATGDPMNSVACYKPNRCLPAAEALKACERHLARDLVQSYHFDKVSPARYAEILQIKAADIQRGIDHLHVIQSMDSEGAVPCPSIKTAFMPKIAELARRHSVYGAGQY